MMRIPTTKRLEEIVSQLEKKDMLKQKNYQKIMIERIKMSQYKLIAFDMDGTLLNSQKKISLKSIQAIKKAIEVGKIVIFNTGRCPAELEEYFEVLDEIQYLNCVSGALVFDRKNNINIYTKTLDVETIKQLLEITSEEDTMVHLLSKDSIVQKDKIDKMFDYNMGVYQEMYQRVTDKWEDLYRQYYENPFPVEKLNIYHTTSESRERTRQRILESGLEVELAYAETTSLEISPKGIDKGIGLEKLCEYLEISLNETIVVGDADNDIGAMKKAGLAIAMDNANENIKGLADVIVSDNDHDGCVEVIEKYLL